MKGETEEESESQKGVEKKWLRGCLVLNPFRSVNIVVIFIDKIDIVYLHSDTIAACSLRAFAAFNFVGTGHIIKDCQIGEETQGGICCFGRI